MPSGNLPRAAVPNYVGSEFSETPPGHRYRLYLKYWGYKWEPSRESKLQALQDVVSFSKPAQEQLRDVLARQEALAKASGTHQIKGVSTSPFATGLGIEHPMENGFAFLDPYGLPYLPGSSVKGVVRRAAEELALFEDDSRGWSIPAVWWLFGFDANSSYLEPAAKDAPDFIGEENERWRLAFTQRTSSHHKLVKPFWETIEHPIPEQESVRLDTFCEKLQESLKLRRSIHFKGSLEFWDVIPDPPESRLRIDIMNPHYTHYYQKGEPPGDWGLPTPIFFLTLPAKTGFTFYVRLRSTRNLPDWFLEHEQERPRWHNLVDSALAFAFEWLGFGAKTAVGYGRMRLRSSEGKEPTAEAATQETDRTETHQASPLNSIGDKIQSLNLEDRLALDSLVNTICRFHKDSLAPEVARMLWDKVKHLDYQISRLKKNSVFMELLHKGG